MGSEELNQKWFAGETGPKAGWACPPKTMRDKSARLMAMEIALRNSVVRNQVFLVSGSGAEDGCLLLGRMGGENGDLIKEAFESCHRSGKGDDHRVRRRCLDDDLAIAGAERVASGRVQLRIHQCFHGVSDIFGGEWRAIGEMQTASETE